MKFHIRSVTARCACGGEDFEPRSPGDLSISALFACAACGRELRRFDLLMQISEEVLRRSHEYLERLHARRALTDDDAPG